MSNFSDFLEWEQSTRDTLDVKKIYIDMAGDLTAGIALSELVYWYLPGKNGQSKLRVEHDGQQWIAVTRYEWWDRIRATPRQMDRVMKVLRGRGLVETAIYRFNGLTTTHIRIIQEKFLELFNALVKVPMSNPYTLSDSPNGESGITTALIAITENTTETNPTATNQEPHSIPKEQELNAPTPQEGTDTVKPDESSTLQDTPFQALFSAVCAEFGYDTAKLTKDRRGLLNRVAGELVTAGCTVPEVHYLKLYLDVLKREQDWKSYGPAAFSKYYNDYAAEQAEYDRTHPTRVSEPPSGKAFELEARLVRFALDSGNADLVPMIRRAARGIAPDMEALGAKSNG